MKQIGRDFSRKWSFTAGTIYSKIILSVAAEGSCLDERITIEFFPKRSYRVF